METIGALWRDRVRATERRRDIGDALLTFAAGSAFVAVGLVNTGGRSPGLPGDTRWLYLLPLLAICLVMVFKRHHPLAALAAGAVIFGADVAMGGSIGVLLGFFDLVYAAALRAPAGWVRRLELGVGVLVPATAITTFVVSGDPQVSLLVGLAVFAVLGTPLWWGRSVRHQTELAEMAAERARDLERLAELRSEEVVREERTQMARDLHDALAGQLSTIAIQSESILATPNASPERHEQGLRAIRSASVLALREMRSMIGLLRTGADPSTSPARLNELDELVEGFAGQGLRVEVAARPQMSSLPAAVDQAAYRIVQESLTNELKHGGGEVRATVTRNRGALNVEVLGGAWEGSSPPEVSESGGIGLLTMRERAEALGGTFEAGWCEGVDGRRWRVSAVIPLEEMR
ncbi:hypothetical protein BHE97_13375 [Aeromicrobium sp. PE09-221]|nr:hypothetical protein BHE97_13375 [Aeromicrobium sp. PE09-221]